METMLNKMNINIKLIDKVIWSSLEHPILSEKILFKFNLFCKNETVKSSSIHDALIKGIDDIQNGYFNFILVGASDHYFSSKNLKMDKEFDEISNEFMISKNKQDSYTLYSKIKYIKSRIYDYIKDNIIPINDNIINDDFDLNFDPKIQTSTLPKDTLFKENQPHPKISSCCILLMSEEKYQELGLSDGIYVLSYSNIKLENKMIESTIDSIYECLEKSNIDIKDIDLFEIDEISSGFILALLSAISSKKYCLKKYKNLIGNITMNKLNINGR